MASTAVRPQVEADEDLQELQQRLEALGVVITPATVGPNDPVPEPLQVEGVSLSTAVVELRDEE